LLGFDFDKVIILHGKTGCPQNPLQEPDQEPSWIGVTHAAEPNPNLLQVSSPAVHLTIAPQRWGG
jgi:hypothetical protein